MINTLSTVEGNLVNAVWDTLDRLRFGKNQSHWAMMKLSTSGFLSNLKTIDIEYDKREAPMGANLFKLRLQADPLYCAIKAVLDYLKSKDRISSYTLEWKDGPEGSANYSHFAFWCVTVKQ